MVAIRKGLTAVFELALGADDEYRMHRILSQVSSLSNSLDVHNCVKAAFPDYPYSGRYLVLQGKKGLSPQKAMRVARWALNQVRGTIEPLATATAPEDCASDTIKCGLRWGEALPPMYWSNQCGDAWIHGLILDGIDCMRWVRQYLKANEIKKVAWTIHNQDAPLNMEEATVPIIANMRSRYPCGRTCRLEGPWAPKGRIPLARLRCP
jgi:hypothetical protein